ncbi:hypothetical protein D3C84_1136640 [compost metagenome]
MAEAVAGLSTLVTHYSQCFVDGVLAHGAVGVLLTGKHKRIFACDRFKQAQDLNGLIR